MMLPMFTVYQEDMYIARIELFNWNQKFLDVQLSFEVIFLLIEFFMNYKLHHKHLTFGWVSIGLIE